MGKGKRLRAKRDLEWGRPWEEEGSIPRETVSQRHARRAAETYSWVERKHAAIDEAVKQGLIEEKDAHLLGWDKATSTQILRDIKETAARLV